MAEYKPRADGDAAAPPPTADAQRLRRDIDGGRTGDKIPVSDPAAAPLGTDDEAAGTRPTGGAPPPRVPLPGHGKGGEAGSARGLGVAIASTLAVVAVVLAVVIVAT